MSLVDGTWIGANFTDADQRSEAQHAALVRSGALIAELEAADEVVIKRAGAAASCAP